MRRSWLRPTAPASFATVTRCEWLADIAVLPHTLLARARLVAEHGRLVAIDQEPPSPAAIHLPGTVLPGAIDLQVNGAGGASVATATRAALDTVADAVWAGGATAFLPTLITAPFDALLAQVAAVADWVRNYRGAGATPLGLHLEGPFLQAPGAHPAPHLIDPTPERLAALHEAAQGTLRLVTLAHSRNGAAAACAWLRHRGVAVALGHCSETAGFAACVDAGATAVTHLFNAMGGLHHRDVGVPALALDEPRLFGPLILDGVHVHPTMVRHAFRILGPDRTILVTDAVAAAGMPDGTYELGGLPVRAERGVVRDSAGRLAGSALTMAAALRNFAEHVPWVGPWTLAKLAATNPARLLGLTDRGGLVVGQHAAFTHWAPDGRLSAVRSHAVRSHG